MIVFWSYFSAVLKAHGDTLIHPIQFGFFNSYCGNWYLFIFTTWPLLVFFAGFLLISATQEARGSSGKMRPNRFPSPSH